MPSEPSTASKQRMKPSEGRRPLSEVRRLVVKVGTSSLVDPSGDIDRSRLAKVVREVAAVSGDGRTACILVSSGAIAFGLSALGVAKRPGRLPALQAAAAVGQGRLMSEYARLFARHRLVTAQILLTQDDFVRRRQFVNAQKTFEHLLGAGAIPVVNENDTVATEEITFGDNDRLAALVAIMVKSDLLVLLSDVDGIYTRDPRRRGARLVAEILDPLRVETTGPGSAFGSGGMASKLQAAGLATAAGIPTVVARASRRDVLSRILAGEALGTWLPPRSGRKPSRKAWMAFATAPRGRIHVDAGAERALRDLGKSLLAAGVVRVEGSFAAGDPVEVVGPTGAVFARGLAGCPAQDLANLAEQSRRQRSLASWRTERPLLLRRGTGHAYDGEVIHRDELVVTAEDPWRS
jgi:glutamate 5-kinase